MESSGKRVDRLFYLPPSDNAGTQGQDYLIFMIGGNPGLISYYEPFLETLHDLLCSSSAADSARFYVYGNSLAGFDNATPANGKESPGPLGLRGQIRYTEDLIYSQIDYHHRKLEPESTPKVILIGHSVGAYILLELVRRHRQRVEDGEEEDFDLIGGILLFPTIVNIRESPMGHVASVSSLSST